MEIPARIRMTVRERDFRGDVRERGRGEERKRERRRPKRS